MDRRRRRIRFYLGLSLLVGLALASCLRFFHEFVIKGHPLWGNDEITLLTKDLRGLEEALPRRGVISFWNGQNSSFPGRDQAQNVLSPRLLTTDLKSEWLIVDRRNGVVTPSEIWESYQLNRDFGNGILLLKRSRTE